VQIEKNDLLSTANSLGRRANDQFYQLFEMRETLEIMLSNHVTSAASVYLGQCAFYPVEFCPGQFSGARVFEFGVDVVRHEVSVRGDAGFRVLSERNDGPTRIPYAHPIVHVVRTGKDGPVPRARVFMVLPVVVATDQDARLLQECDDARTMACAFVLPPVKHVRHRAEKHHGQEQNPVLCGEFREHQEGQAGQAYTQRKRHLGIRDNGFRCHSERDGMMQFIIARNLAHNPVVVRIREVRILEKMEKSGRKVGQQGTDKNLGCWVHTWYGERFVFVSVDNDFMLAHELTHL